MKIIKAKLAPRFEEPFETIWELSTSVYGLESDINIERYFLLQLKHATLLFYDIFIL